MHHEDEQEQGDGGGNPSQSDAQDHQRAQGELNPRHNARGQLHEPDGIHVIGIDTHGEEKLIIAQMPVAVEVKLGIGGIDKDAAERDAAGQQQEASGAAGEKLIDGIASGHGSRRAELVGQQVIEILLKEAVGDATLRQHGAFAAMRNENRRRAHDVAHVAQRCVFLDGGVDLA